MIVLNKLAKSREDAREYAKPGEHNSKQQRPGHRVRAFVRHDRAMAD